MTPEKKVQSKIIEYLKSLDYRTGGPLYYERRNATGSTYTRGSADIYCICNGAHLEIEVKAPGGVTSSAQDAWHHICDIVGAHYILVDNLDDFIKELQKYL